MKTAKDQKINYLKYEKEHRKPAISTYQHDRTHATPTCSMRGT